MILYLPGRASDLDRPDLQALIRRGIERGIESPQHDWAKVMRANRAAIDHHFAWLAQDESGRAVAYLSALVAPALYEEGEQATVIGWYSERPGCGAGLMRRFMAWCRATLHIRWVHVLTNPMSEAETRALRRMLRRYQPREIPAFHVKL